jgi:imidazolonepropionase-like amidohydrolase
VVYAIRAARCFDGGSDGLAGPVQVVVEGSRIVAVEQPQPVASEVAVLDLGDVTLLPGLIDAHTHLSWNAGHDAVARVAADDATALLDQAKLAASTALTMGITTVRDLGDRGYVTLRLREELRLSPDAGPHLVVSGPPITTRGGHCGFLGGEADTDLELRAAVRARAERGVDVIKVMATGGNMTPGGPSPEDAQYSRRQLTVFAAAAHDAGLPITAHAHGAGGASDAIAAGFDALEHGGFWTADGAYVEPAVVADMTRKGVFVVATAAQGGLPDPALLPPAISSRLPAMLHVMHTMRDSGVQVAFASDAGIGPAKPHDVLAHSLPYAVRGGWSVPAALRAMTSIAAAACGLGASKGRIAPGYDCDLLAVSGNPYEDASALAATYAVVRAGSLVRGPKVTTIPSQHATDRDEPPERVPAPVRGQGTAELRDPTDR